MPSDRPFPGEVGADGEAIRVPVRPGRRSKIELPPNMKRCSPCTRVLPLDAFGTHSGERGGLTSRCRECNANTARVLSFVSLSQLPGPRARGQSGAAGLGHFLRNQGFLTAPVVQPLEHRPVAFASNEVASRPRPSAIGRPRCRTDSSRSPELGNSGIYRVGDPHVPTVEGEASRERRASRLHC